MKITLDGVKRIIREIFSEPNGGGLSWGRVASGVALVAAIVWVTRILILTHGLPALDGITGFVIAPYTANKVGTAVQSFSQNPVSAPPAPTAPVVPPPMVPPPTMVPPAVQQ